MFNREIRQKVEPFLLECGFTLIDYGEDSLEYVSSTMTVKFTERGRSICVFVGWRNDNLILLDRDILFNVFGFIKKLESMTVSEFADNVSSFFKGEACRLLVGDEDERQRVMEYQLDGQDGES